MPSQHMRHEERRLTGAEICHIGPAGPSCLVDVHGVSEPEEQRPAADPIVQILCTIRVHNMTRTNQGCGVRDVSPLHHLRLVVRGSEHLLKLLVLVLYFTVYLAYSSEK